MSRDQSRDVIICANWKMYKTIGESKEFIHNLPPLIKGTPAKVLIAVPFTSLSASAQEAKGTEITIGAQNIWDADEGAFTGEISAKMIIDAGAKFVILGHSERRRYFQETDQLINKKVLKALSHELEVILCVGEDSEQRQKGRQKEVVQNQLEQGLKHVKYTNKIFIAYEPTWAIGTGVAATPEVIQEMHKHCREKLIDVWDRKEGEKVPILYGGSVSPKNAKSMLDQPDIDGLLVGTASLSLESFSKIVNYDRVSVP